MEDVNKDHHNVKGIALTVCHFECEEHLQKYLDRYKLKPKDYNVLNRYGKSLSQVKNTRQTYRKDLESVITEVQVQFANENPAWILLETLLAMQKVQNV